MGSYAPKIWTKCINNLAWSYLRSHSLSYFVRYSFGEILIVFHFLPLGCLITGSGFKSVRAFRSGYFGASIKLQSGYTAGVITAFYVRILQNNNFFFFFAVSLLNWSMACSSRTMKLIPVSTMKLTLNSWGLHLGSLIPCRQMFTSEGVGMGGLLAERWSLIYGLIPPRTFIIMLYCGVLKNSCK